MGAACQRLPAGYACPAESSCGSSWPQVQAGARLRTDSQQAHAGAHTHACTMDVRRRTHRVGSNTGLTHPAPRLQAPERNGVPLLVREPRLPARGGTPGGRGGGTRQAGSDPRASAVAPRAAACGTAARRSWQPASLWPPSGRAFPLAARPASGWRSWQGAAGAVPACGCGVGRDRALGTGPPAMRLLECAPWDGGATGKGAMGIAPLGMGTGGHGAVGPPGSSPALHSHLGGAVSVPPRFTPINRSAQSPSVWASPSGAGARAGPSPRLLNAPCHGAEPPTPPQPPRRTNANRSVGKLPPTGGRLPVATRGAGGRVCVWGWG